MPLFENMTWSIGSHELGVKSLLSFGFCGFIETLWCGWSCAGWISGGFIVPVGKPDLQYRFGQPAHDFFISQV